MKASIIIPVHNAEPYLAECLDTVFAQTLQDFEVICVDDGSTDRSAQILAEFASAHPSLSVITQECGGVSSARNAGIRAAQGDYLLFVDADDLIYPELLEKAIGAAEPHAAEMTIFGFEDYYARKGACFPRELCRERQLYDRSFDLTEVQGITDELVTPNVWRILYDRRFLMETGVVFREDLWAAEDLAFVYETLFRAKRIVLVDQRLYKYRRDGGTTLTRSYRGCTGFQALSYIRRDAEANALLTPCNMRHFVNLVLDTADYALRSSSCCSEFSELYAEYHRSWGAFVLEHKNLVHERHADFLDAVTSMSEMEYLFRLFDQRRASFELAIADKKKLRSDLDESKRKIKKLEKTVEQVYGSHSYKIGNAVVRVPSKLKKMLKK